MFLSGPRQLFVVAGGPELAFCACVAAFGGHVKAIWAQEAAKGARKAKPALCLMSFSNLAPAA